MTLLLGIALAVAAALEAEQGAYLDGPADTHCRHGGRAANLGASPLAP